MNYNLSLALYSKQIKLVNVSSCLRKFIGEQSMHLHISVRVLLPDE